MGTFFFHQIYGKRMISFFFFPWKCELTLKFYCYYQIIIINTDLTDDPLFIQTFFTALSQNELALINKERNKKSQLCGKPVISPSFQKVSFELLTNFLGFYFVLRSLYLHTILVKQSQAKLKVGLICVLSRISQYGQRFQCRWRKYFISGTLKFRRSWAKERCRKNNLNCDADDISVYWAYSITWSPAMFFFLSKPSAKRSTFA